ncbi:MAG TPA: hypothetical protein VI357_23945 [Mycobacteriales bacterium]
MEQADRPGWRVRGSRAVPERSEPFRRITNRPDLADVSPAPAYSGTIPVLVWSRLQEPERPGPSDVWVAKYLNGGWQSRVFASLGTFNDNPDIATAGV